MTTDPTTTDEPKAMRASDEDWCERFDAGHAWTYTHHAGLPRIETRSCYHCGYLSVQPIREALAEGRLRPADPTTTNRDWHTVIDEFFAAEGYGPTIEGQVGIAERLEAALGLAGWPHTYQPDSPHVEAVRQARAEAEAMRGDFLRACEQIAAMHAAAVGEVRGPIRGPVEDVADVRAGLLRLRAGVEAIARQVDRYADANDAGAQIYARDLRALLADSPETAPTPPNLAPETIVTLDGSPQRWRVYRWWPFDRERPDGPICVALTATGEEPAA